MPSLRAGHPCPHGETSETPGRGGHDDQCDRTTSSAHSVHPADPSEDRSRRLAAEVVPLQGHGDATLDTL